jgi:hypothetical protein
MEITLDQLELAIHKSMCEVSHHDPVFQGLVPDTAKLYACKNTTKFKNVALSVFENLRRVKEDRNFHL